MSRELQVRFDAPGPGEFSSVYLQTPEANFASVNAGDYKLYVGGASINQAFRKALESCGQLTKNRYEVLHEALLARAAASPGHFCRLRPGDVFKRPDLPEATRISRCEYCGSRTECWQTHWASWQGSAHCAACWKYYEEGLFDGILSLSGLVPAGPRMGALHPVGLVSIVTFATKRRPCRNDLNLAMVYAVGPNCGDRKKKGRRNVDRLSKDEFLKVLECVASTIVAAVSAHNGEAVAESLPSIEILRMCLLSGGVYKHPRASKVDVAIALVRGLAGFGTAPCLIDFAFDNDVFRKAYDQLGLAHSECLAFQDFKFPDCNSHRRSITRVAPILRE